MECNVGKTDKWVRMILAFVLGAIGYYYKSWWGLLAFVPLVTSAISFCPIYKILGVSTCGNKSVR